MSVETITVKHIWHWKLFSKHRMKRYCDGFDSCFNVSEKKWKPLCILMTITQL